MSLTDTLYVDKTNWVINLSSWSVSNAEISMLQKGLDFAITPANIPAKKIVTSRQNLMPKKWTLSEELLTIFFNRQNITKEMRDVLNRLKGSESIMVLPAKVVLA